MMSGRGGFSGLALGLDVGAKRIGVATGSTDMKIASPSQFLQNDGRVFANIADIIQAQQISVVVIGLPRNADGQETAQSRTVRDFTAGLTDFIQKNPIDREFSHSNIVFQDESLTSVRAEEQLRLRKHFQESQLRDGTLDSEAAALILQDFLESVGQESKYA
jgi:putative Holliday junction resolvase